MEGSASPVSPVSAAVTALERAARLSDEAIAAQLQQFLDRWHFQVMTSSMGQSWNRLEVVRSAVQMLAYGGVPLTEAEIIKLPRMEEEYMIDYIVDKMDESVRERFDEITEDYAELIAATCKIRSVLDLRSEQEIMDLIETDSSEMCQQVLKQAVLTAGGKVAHLHRCQNTWVNNMETRLDRLTRAAEIAEAAQKQFLIVEAQLGNLGGNQTSKVKKVLTHFAFATQQSQRQMTFAAWRGAVEQGKADKELREMNEQMIAEKEMKLRHMKARCKAMVIESVERMTQHDRLVMQQQWLMQWKREVDFLKKEKKSQEQLNKVLNRVYSVAKKQAEKATNVMTRRAKERETDLLSDIITIWRYFLQELQKEREFEEAVKQTEMKIQDHLQRRKEETAAVFDRMTVATQTGLLTSVLVAWQGVITEERKFHAMEKEVLQADEEFQCLRHWRSQAVENVQKKKIKMMDTSLLVLTMAAWCKETKENSTDKFYNHKVENKRKQLMAVQTLFKSFAKDLEEGLQVNDDSAGETHR